MRSPGTAEDEQESPCAAQRFRPEAEVAPSGRAVATQGRLRSASGQAARRIDSGRAADDVGEIIEGRSAGLCKSEQVVRSGAFVRAPLSCAAMRASSSCVLFVLRSGERALGDG